MTPDAVPPSALEAVGFDQLAGLPRISAGIAETPRLSRWTRLGLAVLSGGMLAASFAPVGFGPLVFVALIPGLIAIAGGGAGMAMLTGVVTAGTWAAIDLWWLQNLSGIGFTVILVWWVLWYGVIFAPLARLLLRRGLGFALLGVPALWVAVDVGRLNDLPAPFPWLYLGYAQWENLPILQLAALGGVWLVTGLIVLVNVGAAAPLVRRATLGARPIGARRLLAGPALAVALLFVANAWGLWRIGVTEAATEPGPRLALVQVNDRYGEGALGAVGRGRALISMTRALADSDPPVDLIVWPETAWPASVTFDQPGAHRPRTVEPQVQLLAKLLGQGLAADAALPEIVTGVHGRLQAMNPLLERPYTTNAVVAFGADGQLHGEYAKQNLVPMGEMVPFASIEFVREQVLAGYGSGVAIPNTRAGTANAQLLLPPRAGRHRGYRYATPICYEAAFPETLRRLASQGTPAEVVSSVARGGSGDAAQAAQAAGFPVEATRRHDGSIDFFVNLSNDNWYRQSAELEQMLAMCVFRAVETRRGMARGTNTGISAFIAPTGRVRAVLTESGVEPWPPEAAYKEVAGVLVGRVDVCRLEPPFVTVGTYVPWAAVGLAVLLLLVSLVTSRRRMPERLSVSAASQS